MITILFILCMAVFGFFAGRWQGGGRPASLQWFDNPFSQMLTGLPLAVIAGLVIFPAYENALPAWLAWYHTALLYSITVIMLVKGHGHNMDLGTADPQGEPEWYEGLISRLYGKISNYWYDFLGLIISGLTYTLPIGLFIANPVVALCGAWKGPAYALGRLLFEANPGWFDSRNWKFDLGLKMDGPTAYGEAFTWMGIFAICAGVISTLI